MKPLLDPFGCFLSEKGSRKKVLKKFVYITSVLKIISESRGPLIAAWIRRIIVAACVLRKRSRDMKLCSGLAVYLLRTSILLQKVCVYDFLRSSRDY